MEKTQRILVTAELGCTQVAEFGFCGGEDGEMCRDLVELLSPQERAKLISSFKAERRAQIDSGELREALGPLKA